MGILHASTTYLYCNSLLTNHLNTAQTSSSKTHRSYISVTSLVALDRTPGQNYLLKQKEKRSPYMWTCLTGGRGPVLHVDMSHRWAWACLTHGHVSQVGVGLSYTWACLTGGRRPVLHMDMSHRCAWACLTRGHVSQVGVGLSYNWACLTGLTRGHVWAWNEGVHKIESIFWSTVWMPVFRNCTTPRL